MHMTWSLQLDQDKVSILCLASGARRTRNSPPLAVISTAHTGSSQPYPGPTHTVETVDSPAFPVMNLRTAEGRGGIF